MTPLETATSTAQPSAGDCCVDGGFSAKVYRCMRFSVAFTQNAYTPVMAEESSLTGAREARFRIGQVVKHRVFPFRGVIYDVDPVFDNTDEWYEAIPRSMRPHKDQPFYHVYAQNDESTYEAYVSEQNLLPDDSDEPLRHPGIQQEFLREHDGSYRVRRLLTH